MKMPLGCVVSVKTWIEDAVAVKSGLSEIGLFWHGPLWSWAFANLGHNGDDGDDQEVAISAAQI
jgi:hypothetical protein